jgi:hypothetical protein
MMAYLVGKSLISAFRVFPTIVSRLTEIPEVAKGKTPGQVNGH